MNRIVFVLCGMSIVLSLLSGFLSYFWELNFGESWYLWITAVPANYSAMFEAFQNFIDYFIITSWLIPMSLMVSLEIVKFLQGLGFIVAFTHIVRITDGMGRRNGTGS